MGRLDTEVGVVAGGGVDGAEVVPSELADCCEVLGSDEAGGAVLEVDDEGGGEVEGEEVVVGASGVVLVDEGGGSTGVVVEVVDGVGVGDVVVVSGGVVVEGTESVDELTWQNQKAIALHSE
jgi:hypothetical protein